jgi:hypothetical protein
VRSFKAGQLSASHAAGDALFDAVARHSGVDHRWLALLIQVKALAVLHAIATGLDQTFEQRGRFIFPLPLRERAG